MNITTKKKFRQEIISIVESSNVGYLEAILDYCERNNLEVETVGKLVTGEFKTHVEKEASKLRLIKPLDDK